MKILGLIIILFKIRNYLACWGAAPPIEGDTGATDSRFEGNLSDPTKWDDHWVPPPGFTLTDYYTWMDDYKKKQEQKLRDELSASNGSWPDKPANAGADWPAHWKGLGPGSSGVPPPPWLYIAQSSGKADLCFLPPSRGPCTTYEVRWGFNPYVDDCREFVFGGCDGNLNNFVNQRRCREACVGTPVGNCLSGVDMDEDMDQIDFPEVPEKYKGLNTE